MDAQKQTAIPEQPHYFITYTFRPTWKPGVEVKTYVLPGEVLATGEVRVPGLGTFVNGVGVGPLRSHHSAYELREATPDEVAAAYATLAAKCDRSNRDTPCPNCRDYHGPRGIHAAYNGDALEDFWA